MAFLTGLDEEEDSLAAVRMNGFAPLLFALGAAACSKSKEPAPGTVRVLPAADVQWQMLNPLRGDKSPKAGTLWGDRGAPVPCGFLVKFVDGFSSPPHIHPVTYRGVVISGLVHNDDPRAEKEWLAPGTFWTQPAGEVHITAAKGSTNVAYIEIERGPYLVQPAKDAFDPTEEPVKLPPEKMDWRDPPGLSASAKGPRVASLSGNPGDDKLTRTLVRLPAGFDGALRSDGADLHVVVIAGRATHEVVAKSERTTLEPGGYFGSTGKVAHLVACGGEGCLLYVRTDGTYQVSRKK